MAVTFDAGLVDEEALVRAIETGQIERLRYAAPARVPAPVLEAANAVGLHVARAPVLAEGRIELLWYLREQSISCDYHRYGNLGERAEEQARARVVEAVTAADESLEVRFDLYLAALRRELEATGDAAMLAHPGVWLEHFLRIEAVQEQIAALPPGARTTATSRSAAPGKEASRRSISRSRSPRATPTAIAAATTVPPS